MDIKMRIPVSVDLTKEEGWSQDIQDKYRYFIGRLYVHIEQYQDEENPINFGEIITPYRTTDHSEAGQTITIEHKYTKIHIEETTRTVFLENEFTSNLAAEIGASIEFPFNQTTSTLASKLSAGFQEKIKSSVTRSFSNTTTISSEVSTKVELYQKIEKNAKELHLAIAGYKKYRWEVYLHYIDYLLVEYRPTTWGLRKKKTNWPRPVGSEHVNRIKMNLPLFKITFWEFDPRASLIYTESEYKQLTNKIKNPDRVITEKLETTIDLPLPAKPEKPTLYTLSNIAFPLRWVDRKGPWTKEDLMKLEMKEAVGSAWWFQYGPGRKSSKKQK